MSDKDPVGLADPASNASPLLREALAAARAAGPSPDALSRVAARLPLAPGPGGTSGGGGGPVAAAAAPPSVLSGAVIGAIAGAIVSAAALLWPAPNEPPRAPETSVAASASTPTPAAPAPTSTRAAVAVEAPPTVDAAPRRAAAASASMEAAGAPSATASAAPAPPEDAETEAHMLERARDALAGRPAVALAVTDAHAARFRGGVLAQERELIAIDALSRMGRRDEARARADRFAASYPGSAHLRRVLDLTGGAR